MKFEELQLKYRVHIHFLDPINGEPAIEARYFISKEAALAEVKKINELRNDLAEYIGPDIIDP